MSARLTGELAVLKQIEDRMFHYRERHGDRESNGLLVGQVRSFLDCDAFKKDRMLFQRYSDVLHYISLVALESAWASKYVSIFVCVACN